MSRLKLRDPDFATLLYDRYFGINTDQDPVFTEDEYAYLASAPTLRVAYDAYPRAAVLHRPRNGRVRRRRGTAVRRHLARDRPHVRIRALDRHDDAFAIVERGDVDIVDDVDREADPEATKGLVSTTGPYLRDPMALVVGPNSPSEGSRIALPRGFALAAEMERPRTSRTTCCTSTPRNSASMPCLTGTADTAYADTHVANYLLAESQYETLSVTTVTAYTNAMSIGVAGTADATTGEHP